METGNGHQRGGTVGIFDFIKGAGRKEEEEQDEAVREAVMANRLRRYVSGLGFEVENLNVQFDDGVATARGKVKSQADREKIILALGNTQGVAQVMTRWRRCRRKSRPSSILS
jgi:osmotically-inducible protein OsmY